MNYTVGIGVVLFIQLVLSGAAMYSSLGTGSFIGLGAMIFAVYGIPITAIINFLLIRRHRNTPRRSNVVWLIVVSSLLPILQLTLLTAQLALDL